MNDVFLSVFMAVAAQLQKEGGRMKEEGGRRKDEG
jgi:hypothetical protein